ncbi:MAG: PQQ-binding-like beta-propeller repeat protein, partial [Chloroflexi bacterium]|nr:PQQ-binding-like beta-propeller repeat protein [Chloroflexota bacterium]
MGRFSLGGLIATHGLTSSYRGLDIQTGAPVVIKVLSGYFRGQKQIVQRFFHALERVRSLRYPGIVVPLEMGTDGANSWLVYPYIAGETLAEMLRHRSLTGAEGLSLLRGVAEALDYAHAKGIVHGDLKPSNIFVGLRGEVSVTDFGMAALATEVAPLVRSTLNTPHPSYTAPEHAQGFPAGPASDVYSLGALAYELVTGRVPFLGLESSAVLAKQLTMNPEPPSRLNPALPQEIDPMLQKALARRPEQRYATAVELVQAMEAALTSKDGVVFPLAQHGFDTDEILALPGSGRPESSPSIAPPSQGTILCPACGSENPIGVVFCGRCWARIGNRPSATLDQVRRWRQRVGQELLRRRLLTFTAVGIALVALVLWAAYQIVGPNPFLGAATSQVNPSEAPGDWPMLGGNPRHTAYVPEGTLFQGRVDWTYRTSAPLMSSPAVVGGRVYLATGQRTIVALDAANGSTIWELPTTGPVDSSPVVAGQQLFVGLRDGRLIAVDIESGQQQWAFQTDNPISSSPAVAKGVVYVASADGFLYALDAATGKKRWRYELGGWLLASPSVSEGAVVAMSSRGILHVLDAHSGRHRLSYDARFGSQAPATIEGKRLIMGTDNGILRALEWQKVEYPFERALYKLRGWLKAFKILKNTPTQKGFLWSFRAPRAAFTGAAAVAEGITYVGATNGVLYALDVSTGAQRWALDTASSIMSSPV